VIRTIARRRCETHALQKWTETSSSGVRRRRKKRRRKLKTKICLGGGVRCRRSEKAIFELSRKSRKGSPAGNGRREEESLRRSFFKKLELLRDL